MTPELKMTFKKLLKEKGVDLWFSYGHWSGLAKNLREEGGGYGLVMTAETIYAETSVEPLIDALRAATTPSDKIMGSYVIELEERIGKLDMADKWAKTPLREVKGGMTLIAAKVSRWRHEVNSCPNCNSIVHDLLVIYSFFTLASVGEYRTFCFVRKQPVDGRE